MPSPETRTALIAMARMMTLGLGGVFAVSSVDGNTIERAANVLELCLNRQLKKEKPKKPWGFRPHPALRTLLDRLRTSFD